MSVFYIFYFLAGVPIEAEFRAFECTVATYTETNAATGEITLWCDRTAVCRGVERVDQFGQFAEVICRTDAVQKSSFETGEGGLP